MRILALDVGDSRTGIALSDPGGFLASPLTTINHDSDDAVIAKVIELVAEHDASEIVVGIPYMMSGRVGPQARRTMDFADALAEHTNLPIRRVDERLSSVQAERMIQQTGSKPSRNKGKVDAVAAAIILQSYLDSNARP